MWKPTNCLVGSLVLSLVHAQNDASYQPAGFQTGPDTGSSFAAASMFNPNLNAVLFAGTTNGNYFQPHTPGNGTQGCFFATMKLPGNGTTNLTFLERQTLMIPDVGEVCTNLLLHGDRIVATGYAGKGGLLDPLFVPGGYNDVSQVGMVLDLLQSSSTATSLAYRFVGGHLIQEMPITYPVALTALPGDSVMYIAAMESETAKQNQETPSTVQDPSSFLAYGSNFFMTVTKVSIAATASISQSPSIQESMNDLWRVPIATKGGQSVYVSGIQKISDSMLVVTGTTAGQGAAFGKDVGSTTDFDGFVTKMNPATGALVGNLTNAANPSAAKIGSINDRDDWISGMCINPRDPNHIYVVGATRGKMDASNMAPDNADSVEAFCMKLEVERLIPVWTHQLGAYDIKVPSVVRGISCAVTPDGQNVYYGGVVENNAVLAMSGLSQSYGGNDIFVVKLDASNGNSEFVRQIGSERNDEIAPRGGLTTDAAGNAVVVGNTFGSLYRQRGAGEPGGNRADVFVTTISRFNGAVVLPIRPPSNAHQTNSSEPVSSGTSAGNPYAQDQPVEPSKSAGGGIGRGLIVGLAIGVTLGAIGLFLYCLMMMCDRGEVETDRSKVLGYLGDFDVDHVDLRHSATGGWHCSYSGPLSHGVFIGKAESRARLARSNSSATSASSSKYELISPLTGTSIIEDLLDSDNGGGGLGDSLSDHQARNGHYSGLVDAYNSTWNEVAAKVSEDTLVPPRQRRGEWGKDII